MMSVVEVADMLADTAHHGQKRKYTGAPYIAHPRAVGELVKEVGGDDEMVAAALLHDVVEDTDLDLSDLRGIVPDGVVEIVDYMTEREHEGNRKARKAAERERLALGGDRCQTVKLCDMTDNAEDISTHDPDFARVYLVEMRLLLDELTLAWPAARLLAEGAVRRGEERLVQHALRRMGGSDG